MKKKRRPVMAQNTIPEEPATTAPENRLQNLEEKIRQRAYELYEARGGQEGHDLDDWLQAEAEITGTKAHATAA